MTVIQPNSISGINSITAKTNEAVAFYEADGTTGNVIAGVVTATKLHGEHNGSGANLTSLPSAQLTGALPALNASNLTNIAGANITGTIPLSALGNAPTQASVDTLSANVAVLGFKIAVNGSLSKYSLVDQVIDEYVDATGIDASASSNEEVGGTGANKYYYGGSAGSTTYNTTYNYTGSDVTIATQNGGSVTGTVKLWGAAGGQDSSSSGSNHFGGGGSFVSATFNWTSDGSNLIFSVGQGGIKGQKNGSAGNGGGYTGIFKGSKTQANALLIAAGGGGAGDAGGDYGAPGGNFSAGVRGGGTDAGYGASSSAGGAAGGNSGNHPATAGGALAGGHGGSHEARQQSASYNGGGIQGQEPGGVMGGGGGGGGYWGGGGGANGNHGAGGGSGVSFYQSSGSYWQGTPTAEGGNDYNAGGDDDSDYPANIGKGGHTTSEIDGGHGAIVPNISVSSVVSGGNLVLQSNASTASSAPTKGDLVLLIEDGGSGTSTLNTDIKGYISRDNGTNFTQGTLIDEGSWGTNKKIVAFHNLDISGQPSGTSMKYKITTHNQHSTSKITRIHATSLGWK